MAPEVNAAETITDLEEAPEHSNHTIIVHLSADEITAMSEGDAEGNEAGEHLTEALTEAKDEATAKQQIVTVVILVKP